MFHHEQIMFSSRSVRDILEIHIYEFTAQSQATASFLNLTEKLFYHGDILNVWPISKLGDILNGWAL